MDTKDSVRHQVDTAWEVLWRRFFREETHLFYDYLTNYDDDHCQDHLPTPPEVQAQVPNPCGWGTGMEDSMINAGVVMVALCDRYDVTGEEMLKEDAARVFSGMVACAEVHGVRGFVVRSICLEDQKSVYTNTSRDQYTHYVHGLWRFFHSPLSDERQRSKIGEIITWICAYMEKTITPENDYDLSRLDGSRPSAVTKMWQVSPHEAARLPMFYAAGWRITGVEHWRDMYRQYAWPAARQSLEVKPGNVSVGYALYQMQCSLELLYEAETEDEDLRLTYWRAMQACAELVSRNALQAAQDAEDADLSALCLDWRRRPSRERKWGETGYVMLEWNDGFLKAFMGVRESAEAPLVKLMCPGYRLCAQDLRLFRDAVLRPDFERHAGYGLMNTLAAYWRLCREGVDLDD